MNIAEAHYISSAISPSYKTMAPAAKCSDRKDLTNERMNPSSAFFKSAGENCGEHVTAFQNNLPAFANSGTRWIRLLQLNARISVCKKLRKSRQKKKLGVGVPIDCATSQVHKRYGSKSRRVYLGSLFKVSASSLIDESRRFKLHSTLESRI